MKLKRLSSKRFLSYIFLGLLIWVGLLFAVRMISNPGTNLTAMLKQDINAPQHSIVITDHVLGQTTQYIGAVEGNTTFDPADLEDLSINTYRIYGGMSRWEPEDDDEIYGWPSVAEIKADPNLINWEFWDQAMTNPPYGSDYWWSGKPGEVWSGSADTLFSTLKSMGIRPVLNIRNVDNSFNPAWARQLNPPKTEADWNEWWEHVFATVYWLNVRNDYRVDEFEIHNEPDNSTQGWSGTTEDYFELVRVSKDAIDFVYKKFIPNRQYSIHAPISLGKSHWPFEALRHIPESFDSLNVHDYDTDVSLYVRKVRGWAESNGHSRSPIWLGEWGSHTNDYNDDTFALNLVKNMIRASQPFPNYVFGSHIFSLYDWGIDGKHQGLVDPDGKRRLSYYAFRLGTRALQGGKSLLELQKRENSIVAAATKSDNHLFLLLVNSSSATRFDVDVSAHLQNGRAKQWEFSRSYHDEVADFLPIQNGSVNVTTPSKSVILLEITAD